MKYSVWKNDQTKACYIAVDVSNPLRPELICTPYGRYIPLDDAEAEMIVTMLNNQVDKIIRLQAEIERLTKGHSIDFVRAEMYRHLLDENAKLKEEVMRMRNDAYKEGDIIQKCCEHQKNRIERLKAEVERLTKKQ